MDVARARDVLHEVDAVVFERPGDAFEDRCWFGLVVDRVEGGDEVVARGLVERRGVLNLETNVRRAVPLGLGYGPKYPLFGDVVAGEVAVGEGAGHKVKRPAATAA